MAKKMQVEKEIVMKVSREIYEGQNLEKYLEQASKKKIQSFAKKVTDKLLAYLEREHSGKNFLVGDASRARGNIGQKIECVLKG